MNPGRLIQGSSQSQHNFSQGIDPSQMDPIAAEETSREALGSETVNCISSGVEEMSQLESPQLRELALMLGNMLNVPTPRYEEQHGHPYSHLQIGDRWQVLQGCHDWKGLLDPIDSVLKAEIIRYGEFAQATYDAFGGELLCCTAGDSKYDKDSLLERVGLEKRGYEITNFLYEATGDFRFRHFMTSMGSSRGSSSGSSSGHPTTTSRQSDWIGFVAVSTSPDEIARLGRRDILIAWRGTRTVFEWIKDVKNFMNPAGFGPDHACSHVRVEAGFLSLYMTKNNTTSSARDQVLEAVKTLVEKYKHESKLSITLTGHSLGSALATLCAYDIAESTMNLLSDTPGVPQQWNSEGSRSGAAFHDDSGIRHPHIQPIKNFVHSMLPPSKEDENEKHRFGISGGSRSEAESHEDSRVRHPHTQVVRDLAHSVFHHSKEDQNGKHRPIIMRAVATCSGNEEEPGPHKFPQNKIPITVYSFAGPRVGNLAFRDRIRELGVAVLRVENKRDLVTEVPGLKHIKIPGKILHDICGHVPSYKHVGVKLVVDNEQSPYLKRPAGLKKPHSLEVYLHLVDGYHGSNVPYRKTFRHHALVNKRADFLKSEYYIPPCWWEKKEVARDSNGNWLFPGRHDGTIPKPANPDDEFKEFWESVDEAAAKSKALNSPRSS